MIITATFGVLELSCTSCFVVNISISPYLNTLMTSNALSSQCQHQNRSFLGYPPFQGDNDTEILRKVRQMKYEFPADEWSQVSPEARDLISKMIVARENRLSAKEVMDHPWMTMKLDPVKHKPLNVAGLKRFLQSEKLRKFTLSIIASQSSEGDLKNLSDLFLKIDKDGDGKITYSELEEVLKTSGQMNELAELGEILVKTGVDRDSPFHYNGN